MRENARGELVLTEEERRNGWTEEAVLAYAAERERAAGNLVGGNIVTGMPRGRAPMKIENCKRFNPLKWKGH